MDYFLVSAFYKIQRREGFSSILLSVSRMAMFADLYYFQFFLYIKVRSVKMRLPVGRADGSSSDVPVSRSCATPLSFPATGAAIPRSGSVCVNIVAFGVGKIPKAMQRVTALRGNGFHVFEEAHPGVFFTSLSKT